MMTKCVHFFRHQQASIMPYCSHATYWQSKLVPCRSFYW